MTNSDTSPNSSPPPQAPDSATRWPLRLSDRQARALLAAVEALHSADRALALRHPVSSDLVTQVQRGLSRFPSGGRAGDLDPSLPVTEIVARAWHILSCARQVPAVRDELHPRPGPKGHGKRHRLRYPNYSRYFEKLRKRKQTLSLRPTEPSPSAQPLPPRSLQ